MQREYTQKITPTVDRGECSPKRDKTDIEREMDGLIDRSQQLEKMIINLSDVLKPVMSPNCLVKSSPSDENKMEEISPLASRIRSANISLNNSASELSEIFNRIQI